MGFNPRVAMLIFVGVLGTGCAFGGDREVSSGAGPARVDQRSTSVAGQLLYPRPLRSLGSREHYVVEVTFTADEGAVTLFSHLNDFVHRDGVMVRVRRAADRALWLGVGAPGIEPREVALPPGFVTNEGRLKFRVEVHNGLPGGARVLFWRFGQSLQGEVERPRPFISAGNADFDTAAARWMWPSHGRGVHFGVEFDRARVLSVRREAPYVD